MLEGIYYITSADPAGRYLDTCRAVLAGGVRVLQYRDKQRRLEEQVPVARRLRALCREHGATFLINDHPRLALKVDADGVHLGQNDTPPAEARKILGPNRLIGVSTRTVAQARAAVAAGADYIAVGSMYPTGSKQDAELVGPERLGEIRRVVDRPLVAIGGIDRDRAARLFDLGADAVAVISALRDADDPRLAARELALVANRRRPEPRGRVLTIAGSDSGGGAGIQADLKTITLLGGYGMSALTALTAQNTTGVSGIHPCPPDFVRAQATAVLDDIGADLIKTGMLYSADIVATVADLLEGYGLPAVVDPVMIAKGGAPLLRQDAVATLIERLLPKTYLLTPNVPEAAALSGIPIESEKEMLRAGERLRAMGARNVLVKGGHLRGDAIDLLLTPQGVHRWSHERLAGRNTHGTGCTFSAAIATLLACGEPLPVAVDRAKQFITAAIAGATDLGRGHGPVNHWEGAKTVDRIQNTGVRRENRT